jgi:hypothetical protein
MILFDKTAAATTTATTMALALALALALVLLDHQGTCPLPNHDIDDATLIGFDPRNYFFKSLSGFGTGMPMPMTV